MIQVALTQHAWEDYMRWQREDPDTAKKIVMIAKDIAKHPYVGLGGPQMLTSGLSGYWSRRIDNVHRLVYQYSAGEIRIISCYRYE